MSNTVTINREMTPGAPDEEQVTGAQSLNDMSADNISILLDLAAKFRENPNFDPNAPVQVVAKDKVKIEVDFSKITEDQIFDIDGIEARGFMNSDVLKVNLVDSNYVARWVNKNPKRLGSMIARGFTYVAESEISNSVDQAVSLDSSGHFAYDDVVLMKIPKSIYYPALKKAELDAKTVLGQVQNGSYGKTKADQFMQHEAGGEYGRAQQQKQISFYNPQVGV